MAFGVVTGEAERPRIAWLEQPVPVTPDLLAMTAPVPPTQVLRIAATCQEQRCSHFDGAICKLATRLVRQIETVTAALPPCTIRADCRWFRQEGRHACLRCPQIVTYYADPPAALDRAAAPD